MWNLIKAELDYHRLGLTMVALLITGLFVLITGWVWSSLEIDGRGMIKLLIAANLLLWFTRFIRMTKDKTDRHRLLLPICLRKIGLARILSGLTIWTILLLLFFIVLVLFRPASFQPWIVWYALSTSGAWLAVTALPLIFRDLTHIFTGKYQMLMLAGSYLLLVAALALIFVSAALLRYFLVPLSTVLSLHTFFGDFNSTGSGAMMFMAVSLAASYGSVMIFQARKSFLE